MNIHILVLVIAIALFGVLAFKQMSALILAPLVTIFVILCSGLPILESLKGLFMPAATDYITKYFLTFFVGALFGAVYQYTGAAESIARAIAGLCHGKFVAPIIMCITGILTFGGVSGFVVFFVIYPIALNLFKEGNLTRRLIPAAISAGCWTWSMSAPGSPSIQNVIAMDSLGTPSTAAFVPSLINCFILISGVFFGPVTGLLAGGIGSALSDLLTGYPQWIIPTLIIKGIMGFVIGYIANRTGLTVNMFKIRTAAASIVGIIIMVVGYFIGGSILYGSIYTGATQIPGLVMEGIVGIVLFYVIGSALQAAHLPKYIQRLTQR